MLALDLLPNLTTSEWISLIGTVFTAGTVLAAYLAILQGARAWRRSVEPDLHLQVITDPRQNATHLIVVNAGNGVAKGAAVMMLVSDLPTLGWVGDGIICPADKVRVTPALGTTGIDPGAPAMVMYRTVDESLYAVRWDGRKVRFSKGGMKTTTDASTMWAKVIPEHNFPTTGSLPPTEVIWIERRGTPVTISPVL